MTDSHSDPKGGEERHNSVPVVTELTVDTMARLSTRGAPGANGRGGASCGGHTSSFCLPGEAQGLRSPLKVVCVIMVPLEKDMNMESLAGSKTPIPSIVPTG